MASDMSSRLGINPESVASKKMFLIRYAESLTDRSSSVEDLFWVDKAASATAYYDAAQLAWIQGEDKEAVNLMRRAAKDFINSGSSYGLYLTTLFEPNDNSKRILLDNIFLLDMLFSDNNDVQTSESQSNQARFNNSIGNPTQQAYLIMAMSLHKTVGREFQRKLQNHINNLSAHYAHPIGSQNIPVRTYMNLTRQLHEMLITNQPANENINISDMAAELSKIVQNHNNSFEVARQNSYLWSSVHTNVEFIDFDIVGFIVIMKEVESYQAMSILQDTVFSNHLNVTGNVVQDLSRLRSSWNE
ncbi:hypothetical protein [Candidatus Leptofilum sp.]|uniref:hypothetical protein n=1 Tax=Candidatus Leptofilum sp. TaxID=3241576 RepID=UPI003B5CCA2F